MFSKRVSIVVSVCLVTSALYAEDIKVSVQELVSYTAQKYRLDLNAQTDKSKQDLVNEYAQTVKLSDKISATMKDDVDLKVATRLMTVEIWAQKFMASVNPTESELKKIYDVQKPQVEARYNLRNILIKDEASADKMLKSLNSLSGDKKTSKFKELAKNESEDFTSRNNEGSLGWVDTNKLDKSIQEKLTDKKKGDIVKVNVSNIGWQLLLIEEYQPKRGATFDEAKQVLINIAKQEALSKEIDKLIK